MQISNLQGLCVIGLGYAHFLAIIGPRCVMTKSVKPTTLRSRTRAVDPCRTNRTRSVEPCRTVQCISRGIYWAFGRIRSLRVRRLHCSRSVDRLDGTL